MDPTGKRVINVGDGSNSEKNSTSGARPVNFNDPKPRGATTGFFAKSRKGLNPGIKAGDTAYVTFSALCIHVSPDCDSGCRCTAPIIVNLGKAKTTVKWWGAPPVGDSLR